MNIFIYYAYLTQFYKYKNISCAKNALDLYPPEMTRNALDNPNCSNVLHQFLTNPEVFSFKLTEIWLVL